MKRIKWATVPNNKDWHNSHIINEAKEVKSNANLSFCLICDKNDKRKLSIIQSFLDELHQLIKEHYIHSNSCNWKPKSTDMVYWLSTTYSSQILKPIIRNDTNAQDQFNTPYNCYRDEKEVDALITKVNALINKYGF